VRLGAVQEALPLHRVDLERAQDDDHARILPHPDGPPVGRRIDPGHLLRPVPHDRQTGRGHGRHRTGNRPAHPGGGPAAADPTEQDPPTMTTQPSSGAQPAGLADARATAPALLTDDGTTTISDSVVQKIAGMAANDVAGVYRLGGGAANAISSLKNRLPGSTAPTVTQGVSVQVGQAEATVELNLVAEYGVAIHDVAAAVRRNVISAVTRMTGLSVTSVDVNVDDVHLPTDANESDPATA